MQPNVLREAQDRNDMETPYLLRVIGSLAAILIVNHLTRRLALSMVFGTLLLAVWCGHSPAGWDASR